MQGQRLSVLRAELARPVYRNSRQARTLDEQLAHYTLPDLGTLPDRQGLRPTAPNWSISPGSPEDVSSGRQRVMETTPGSTSSSPSKNRAI